MDPVVPRESEAATSDANGGTPSWGEVCGWRVIGEFQGGLVQMRFEMIWNCLCGTHLLTFFDIL